jgi:hypothetical protein
LVILKTIIGLCFFFCAVIAAPSQVVEISNFSQPLDGYAFIATPYSDATSFTTGTAGVLLSSISVALDGAFDGSGAGNNLGPFSLSLYGDDHGTPGAQLASLSGTQYPLTTGVFTFTNTSPLILSTNTTYWIVAQSPASTGTDGYEWSQTGVATLDSGSVWTSTGSKYNPGTGWVSQTENFRFSVAAADPSPPTISITQPVVLTFPVTGFPFVLQQSPSLTSPTWVPVTNATLSGTLNNQAVFIIPPIANQLFYRLELSN